MWEIEPIDVKIKIQDKKPPEKIAEAEAYKIGFDPCYIIIRQEGVLGESVHEFLYINNVLHKVENTLSPTCEICGRLVVGKNNFPYEVSFNTKEEIKNYCDSCIEKYKGWDNYIESKLLFGADSCEDCGKPTNNKVLTGKKIKVHVCEECINGLTNMGFEKTVNSTIHKSASPFPVQIKGKSKRKQIHKLKLTKYLKPYVETELNSDAPQEIFDEPIEQPRKIPQILIKRKQTKEAWIKKEEKRKNKIAAYWIAAIVVIFLLSVVFVDPIIDFIDIGGKKNTAEYWIRKGLDFTIKRDHKKAVEAYEHAIKIDPNNAETYNKLGNAYGIFSGMYEKAIEAYKLAISIKPDYADAYRDLGYAYKQLNKHKEAIEAYKQAISLTPDNLVNVGAYKSLGDIYSELGMYEEAIEPYKQITNRTKLDKNSIYDHIHAYRSLGSAYSKLGMHEESKKAYKRADRINFAEELAESYGQALTERIKEAEYYYNRGFLYLAKDDKQRALEQYEILKKIDPILAEELLKSIYR